MMRAIMFLIVGACLAACTPSSSPSSPQATPPDSPSLGAIFKVSSAPQRLQLYSGLEKTDQPTIIIHGTGLVVNPSAPCFGNTEKQICTPVPLEPNKTFTLPIAGVITSARAEFTRGSGWFYLKI